MPFVTASGLRLRFRERGAGLPGVPLVLVHGAGGSSVTWLGILGRLGRTARTIALDLPGHGGSEAFAEGASAVSIGAYAGILIAFLDALGIERAVLVGHSMGGAVVLEAALARPERVAALGLLATSAKLGVGPQIFEAIDTRFHDFPELLGSSAFGPSFPAAEAVRLAAAGLQAPQAVVRADFEACGRFDARERLPDVRAHALVVLGEADLLVAPKHSRFLAERLAGARLLALPATGHMVHIERPEAVAESLLELQTRADTPPPTARSLP